MMVELARVISSSMIGQRVGWVGGHIGGGGGLRAREVRLATGVGRDTFHQFGQRAAVGPSNGRASLSRVLIDPPVVSVAA